MFSDTSICSTRAIPPFGNSNHIVASVSIDLPSNSKGDDWDSPCDHLRDVPWEDIFKLCASAAASEFCGWVQVRIDVYIFHCKYQGQNKSFF